MTDTRLQRLEALLVRVRRRAAEGRNGASAAAPVAPAKPPMTVASPPRSEINESNIPTAPPPAAPARSDALPRSLPVQAPESGWPEAPPVPVVAAMPAAPPLPAPPAPASPSEAPEVSVSTSTSVLELVDNAPLETLGEEDLLEIPSDMLESVPPSGGFEAREREEREEEEPPASSQRPRSAHLDDLEQASAALVEEEREVPLKTPPPESGPQAAPPPSLGAPPAVNMDNLLEADLMPPPAAAVSEQLSAPFDSLEQPFGSRPPPPASGPTIEQLGQTIELEEARGPELELDRPLAPPAPTLEPDELEAPLPAQESAGTYDDSLLPPPEAEQELDAHRDGFGGPAEVVLPSAMPELSMAAVPPLATMPAAREVSAPIDVSQSAPLVAELVQRPQLSSVGVTSVSTLAAKPEPRTFLQLLDASIALGN